MSGLRGPWCKRCDSTCWVECVCNNDPSDCTCDGAPCPECQGGFEFDDDRNIVTGETDDDDR